MVQGYLKKILCILFILINSIDYINFASLKKMVCQKFYIDG